MHCAQLVCPAADMQDAKVKRISDWLLKPTSNSTKDLAEQVRLNRWPDLMLVGCWMLLCARLQLDDAQI